MTERIEGRRALGVLSRRASMAALASSAVCVWVPDVHAGSYLDRATVLLHSASEELAYLRRKLYDEELARTLRKVARARVQAAGTMLVPAEVVQAHPHLLLMLEKCERAANAAVEQKATQFLKFARLAQDEAQLFSAVLKHLGWELPKFRT